MICPQCGGQFDVTNSIEQDGKWCCPDDNCELNDSDAYDKDLRLEIKWFEINTHKPEEFITELESLCKKYTSDGYYFFGAV